MASRIRVLDPDVAAKIAAGEVVERPVSVVKELVENAIDAGASRIVVEVQDGGKKSIRVCDDGCGMSKEDAVLAFHRHATSKVRSSQDLERITSLGFRGEALPSIAAVSHVELVTREQGSEVGTKVVVEGGVITEVTEIGCPLGTTVTVSRLFFNTPARLKFVKSVQAELGHISEFIGRFVLSHPHLSFLLTHNDREMLNHSGTSDERAALVTVLGRDAAREMIPISQVSHVSHVSHVTAPLKISGFVSKPTFTKANRSHQFFFVNSRSVRSRALGHAAFHAYQGLVPSDRHPVCVVLIDIEPTLIDVNVHPAKLEVRFEREWEVHSALVQAIRGALTSYQLVPEVVERLQVPTHPHTHPPSFPVSRFPSHSAIQSSPTSDSDLSAFRQALRQRTGRGSLPELATTQPPSAPPKLPSARLPRLRAICQLRNTYILAEGLEGLFIVSQHRAHERVLFEQFLSSREDGRVVSQGLVVPFTLTLGQAESAFVQENLDVFCRTGFEIEPFGQNTFIVRAVPTLLVRHNYEEALRDVIDELLLGSPHRPLEDRYSELKATIACHSAIKAGESLSLPEMERLLEDLCQTSNPYLCPHEQPVIVALSAEELDRRFQRG